ncbi:hypothetical protein AB0K09_15520 [Streptomyces sp. NPDC049577]|uniref:hypothetical protein n=1 Tax=Streptomyces sp. NPDC049577 TaxID=3155153 RepID=UPI003430B011
MVPDLVRTWAAGWAVSRAAPPPAEHRRRGLGASPEGRALYETLGWKTHAPLAACVYRPHE